MFALEWVVACSLVSQVAVGVANIQIVPAGAAPAPANVGAAAKPAPKVPTDAVVTIYDERIEGAVSMEDGKLVVATQPPRKLALDEVSHVELVGTAESLTVAWLGQDGRDMVQAGPTRGTNGIQDIHLQCRGLPAGRRGQQYFVFAPRTSEETQAWSSLETPAFWRMHTEQNVGKSTAEIYIEPPPADCFGQEFEVWVLLDDNRVFKSRVRAATHTDSKLKVGTAAAPQPAASDGPVPAHVLLEGENSLSGELVGLDEDSLTLKLSAGDSIKIPLIQVRACWMGASRPDQLAKQLDKRGETDWVLFKTREDTPTTVDGTLKGLADGKLEMTVSGESRKISADRLLGFVLSARPPQAVPKDFYQVFELRDGQKIFGRLTAMKPDLVEFRTLWDAVVHFPRAQVQRIGCQNGKAAFLSDLEPVSVEETPFLGQPRPHRRDLNLQGAPLSLKGKTYRKGLAVHSRSVLTYPLDGGYAVFQATVGFDDTAPIGGSVSCRVLADGRELYANPTLRQTADPVELKLAVDGAKQLVLVIDFGEAEDVGDRLIWAGARLFREKPPEIPKPAVAEGASATDKPVAAVAPAQPAVEVTDSDDSENDANADNE